MKTLFADRRLALALLVALALTPYFVNLGASSLWDSNEAFYAETPREMIEASDYINPTFNYQPRFNKPPLSYWIVAAFYHLFGVSETTERFAIMIGALTMIATAFALGRLMLSIEAGLFAALALGASPRFLMFSRRIMIDVYLAMFMGLALLFFVLAENRPHRRRLYLALMYAAVGFGILTKGPVAVVLPALAFFIYLAVTGDLSRIRRVMLPAGLVIVTAIVLPWYATVYSEHGWLYIKTFLLKDNLSRYTEPVWGPRRSLFFYLPVILGDMFPWSILLPVAVWLAARFRLKRREQTVDEKRPDTRLLLLIWIAVIVIFFSISSNKEDLYILPIYPAAAAIVGCLLARFTEPGDGRPAPRLTRWIMVAIGVLTAMGGAAILYLFGYLIRDYYLAGATAIGVIALAGGAFAVFTALRRRDFACVVWTIIPIIAVNWVFVLWTLPDFERYKPARALSEIIGEKAGADALVGYYRFASPSMVFYLRRPVFEEYELQDLKNIFSSGKDVYCLMTEEDYREVEQSLSVPTIILASRPVFRLKLRGLLDRGETPQVVLISNRSRQTGSE